MPLDTLATQADLPGSAPSGDRTRALRVASAAIRDAAGSPISATTGTVRVPGTAGKILHVPGPATAVTAVTLGQHAVTDYSFHGEGLLRRRGWGSPFVDVQVTGTFGLSEVPPDIVDLCVELAVSWLQHRATGGGSTAGLKSVRVDDASETYTDEASGQVTSVFIPEVTRAWLARRFGGSVHVVETA